MTNKKKPTNPTTLREAVQNREESISSLIPGISIEKLRRNPELFKYALDYAEGIVETIREPLLVLDKDLKVLTANKAFYKTFQTTQKETENHLVYELGNGQWNIPKLRELLEEILPQNSHFDDFEVEHIFPTIGKKVMYLNARRIVRAINSTPTILLAIEDVTTRRLAEEEAEKHKKELIRSNQELEQFAYIASHDLQEPLRMVVSYLQLLEKRYGGTFDDKAKRWMNFAVDGGKRMQILLGDLLIYSRVATKAKPLEKTDLNTVLQDVLSDLETLIKESKVKIEKAKLPIVKADAVQMSQLLQNLISNAIKFRNKRTPRITITSKHEDSKWTIAVKDNGIGIEKEYFKKIFIIFQRLHTRNEYSGTGIGLAICRKIVDRHGGMLWVESEVGKGTTFLFSMPDKGGDKK